jgi:hypothetical protein
MQQFELEFHQKVSNSRLKVKLRALSLLHCGGSFAKVHIYSGEQPSQCIRSSVSEVRSPARDKLLVELISKAIHDDDQEGDQQAITGKGERTSLAVECPVKQYAKDKKYSSMNEFVQWE